MLEGKLRHANLAKYPKFLKMSPNTTVLVSFRIEQFWKYLSCHRHFQYDDIMIKMLSVSTTNSTISYHLKAFLYMLYFVSYCTNNLPWEK